MGVLSSNTIEGALPNPKQDLVRAATVGTHYLEPGNKGKDKQFWNSWGGRGRLPETSARARDLTFEPSVM